MIKVLEEDIFQQEMLTGNSQGSQGREQPKQACGLGEETGGCNIQTTPENTVTFSKYKTGTFFCVNHMCFLMK